MNQVKIIKKNKPRVEPLPSLKSLTREALWKTACNKIKRNPARNASLPRIW